MAQLPPSPFLSSSAPVATPAADTAAANVPPPRVAAAEPIYEPSSNERRPSEASAPDALNPQPDAGALGTDCIGEIFIGAAMFVSRFVPDMHAIVDAMEYENAPRAEYGAPTWDETPLFLQRAAG